MKMSPCGQCNATGTVYVGIQATRCGMCQGHGCIEVKSSERKPRKRTPSILSKDAGVQAVLADCDDLIAMALKAVEIGAFPGPAWRERAVQMRKLLAEVRR